MMHFTSVDLAFAAGIALVLGIVAGMVLMERWTSRVMR